LGEGGLENRKEERDLNGREKQQERGDHGGSEAQSTVEVGLN